MVRTKNIATISRHQQFQKYGHRLFMQKKLLHILYVVYIYCWEFQLKISTKVAHTKIYLGVSLRLGLHKSCPLKFPLKLDSHNCEWPTNINFRICRTNICFKASSQYISCNLVVNVLHKKSSWVSVYASDYTNPAPSNQSHIVVIYIYFFLSLTCFVS